MANKVNLETVRGMRDFLPEDKILRDEIVNKIKKVFENYGFAPLETPVLEYLEVMKSKGGLGDEALKLVYDFTDKGGRQVGLRYDLTVPLARVIATNPQLPKPFKRYCIDKAWRYERPQAGRYREFYQCDVDTIGAKSPMADAELLACAGDALKAIGLDKFTFRVNSRVLMNELMEGAGVAKNQFVKVLRTLDKLGKVREEEIAKELGAFLSDASVDTLLGLMKLRGNWSAISKTMKICDENRKLIEEFLKYLKEFGIKNFVFDLSLARGLDYYTGFVFEIDAGKGLGSVGGGGRYDDMIGNFTGQKTPATGISLGLERIMEILKEKTTPKKSATKVFVIPIGINVIEIVQKLRSSGINTDTDMMDRGISKNLEFASKQEIPFVIFVGKEELKKKKLKLKDMNTGKEQMLTLSQIIKKLV